MFCILDYNATWFNFLALEKRMIFWNTVILLDVEKCVVNLVFDGVSTFSSRTGTYHWRGSHDSFKILNLELNIHYLVHSVYRSNQDKWVHGRGQWWPPSYIELVFKQKIKYCKESHPQMSGPNFHHQVTVKEFVVRGQGIWWIDRNFASNQSEIAFSI